MDPTQIWSKHPSMATIYGSIVQNIVQNATNNITHYHPLDAFIWLYTCMMYLIMRNWEYTMYFLSPSSLFFSFFFEMYDCGAASSIGFNIPWWYFISRPHYYSKIDCWWVQPSKMILFNNEYHSSLRWEIFELLCLRFWPNALRPCKISLTKTDDDSPSKLLMD